jgi:hypothetical protein
LVTRSVDAGEVFDRGMALAQQAFAPEHLCKIELKYANAMKARLEWKGHLYL